MQKTLTRAVTLLAAVLLLCSSFAVSADTDYSKKLDSALDAMQAMSSTEDWTGADVWSLYPLYASSKIDGDYTALKPKVDYNADYSAYSAGSYAKDIMAAAMYSYDLKDTNNAKLIKSLAAAQGENGAFKNSYGYDSVTETSWAIVALEIAAAKDAGTAYNKSAALKYLASAQLADGGFNDYGAEGNVDTTGMVMVALSIVGGSDADAIMDKCDKFLGSTLNSDGFYVGKGQYDSANSCSQAYAIIGLKAANKSVPDSAVAALVSLQDANGGFWYDAASKNAQGGYFTQPDQFSTTQSAMALADLVYGSSFAKLATPAAVQTTTADAQGTTAAQGTTVITADKTSAADSSVAATAADATVVSDNPNTGASKLNPVIIVVLVAAVVVVAAMLVVPKLKK